MKGASLAGFERNAQQHFSRMPGGTEHYAERAHDEALACNWRRREDPFFDLGDVHAEPVQTIAQAADLHFKVSQIPLDACHVDVQLPKGTGKERENDRDHGHGIPRSAAWTVPRPSVGQSVSQFRTGTFLPQSLGHHIQNGSLVHRLPFTCNLAGIKVASRKPARQYHG